MYPLDEARLILTCLQKPLYLIEFNLGVVYPFVSDEDYLVRILKCAVKTTQYLRLL